MRQHGFEEMVNVPTRGSRNLDIFLTNSPLLWKLGTVHPGLVRSDHLVAAKPSTKYVFFRDSRDLRNMAMDRKLEECDLNFAHTLDDPEECARLFTDKLWAIFDKILSSR